MYTCMRMICPIYECNFFFALFVICVISGGPFVVAIFFCLESDKITVEWKLWFEPIIKKLDACKQKPHKELPTTNQLSALVAYMCT